MILLNLKKMNEMQNKTPTILDRMRMISLIECVILFCMVSAIVSLFHFKLGEKYLDILIKVVVAIVIVLANFTLLFSHTLFGYNYFERVIITELESLIKTSAVEVESVKYGDYRIKLDELTFIVSSSRISIFYTKEIELRNTIISIDYSRLHAYLEQAKYNKNALSVASLLGGKKNGKA